MSQWSFIWESSRHCLSQTAGELIFLENVGPPPCVPCHMSDATYKNWQIGVVYIQIIRWSRSLCVIIEAHNVLRNFCILKKMSGILTSSIGNQNMLVLFLLVFCDSMFSIEIFSTHLTLICFKCLFHMKKHLYEAIPVTFVERSSRLKGTWKNICNKST